MRRSLRKAATRYKKFIPEWREFSIHCGIFDYIINVIISEDLDRCSEYLNQKLEMPARFGEEDFSALGKVFLRKGYCPILWMPKVPTTPQEQGTLAHECLHLVFEVTGWAGISPSTSSEEVYTHFLKYLYTQFYAKATK